MNFLSKQHPVVAALASTVTVSLIAASLYMFFEPMTGFAQTDTNTFTVTQTIGSEISFETAQGDLSMSDVIGGLTGGQASATATVAVSTSDQDGYTLAIAFSDNDAMQHGSSSNPDFIADYGTTTVNADFNFSIGSQNSAFGYAVSSSDAVSTFLSNDTDDCNGAGAFNSAEHCWVMQSDPTVDFTIASDSGATPAAGIETQIQFRVGVAPSSGLSDGQYIATTTLTATVQ